MRVSLQARFLLAGWWLALALAGCGKQPEETKELAYVAAPQVMLRDRVAAVYNKVGTAKNGEKLLVLDHQKRFVKVRTPRNEEGWVEQRYLAEPAVYASAERLSKMNARAPSQGKATARTDTNLHIEPGREADHLYLIKENDKVEVLARATAEKPGTRVAPKDANDKVPPPVVEDWRLVRDAAGHVGWVLARMLDLDAPIEIAQYAEGQRIVAYFVLSEVEDEGKKVPQYLLALSEAKDGLPDDYDQVRIFTWNPKRDHYETAYRERNLHGVLPIEVRTEDFGKEGKLPVFVLRVRAEEGSDKTVERKYKMSGVMVRRVLGPGEEAAPVHTGAKRKRR